MSPVRPRALLTLAPALLAAPGCDAIQQEVLRRTALLEARFVPAEIGAGVALALVELRDYQERTANLAAHWPEIPQQGCVIPEMEIVGDGVQRFTFNYYGCPDQRGYVTATVVATDEGSSLTLEYDDYEEAGVRVFGSLELVDAGGSGRLALDYRTHYDGISAEIAAAGEWSEGSGTVTVDAAGVLLGAAGLEWSFEAAGFRFGEGCEGVQGGTLRAGWEETTEVETTFPAGECSECYTVSVDGGATEQFCPSEVLG